jgi:hypothetical protein
MIDTTILAVSGDESWLASFWTEASLLKRPRLVVAGSIEEANDLIDCTGARLLAIDCRADSVSLEQIDSLLWANSIVPQPAAVLVIDDGYEPDVALTLFQMGVDEYISMSHHGSRIPAILCHLLGTSLARTTAVDNAMPALPTTARQPVPVRRPLVTAALA